MTLEDVRLPRVIEDETRLFLELLDGISPEELAAPSGVGEWTRRDLAAHVAGSARTYVGWIERGLDGITEPPPGPSFVRGQVATDSIAAPAISVSSSWPASRLQRAGNILRASSVCPSVRGRLTCWTAVPRARRAKVAFSRNTDPATCSQK